MRNTSAQPDSFPAEQLRSLETANRLKAEFVANVSHELRTPIHAIIGYTELLLEGVYGAMTADQEQTVQFIRDSAKELLDLVNNLLDLSRIESGRADLILSIFDLRELLGELSTQLKPLADAKHLTLTYRVELDDTRVRTDRGKLKQILLNLAGNAIKFTDRGSVTLTVSAARQQPQRLLIRVADTGIGIPPEKLDRIFERFYQVDSSPSRSHEGTGLGLYIAKQLLELLAGTISVESTPGRGTTVTVSIPKNFEEIEGIHRLRQRIAAASLTARQQPPGSKPPVLVVSDNPDIARILADGLGCDFAVRTAPVGSEVTTLAAGLSPLVILLNADGAGSELWSVFQQLKTNPATRHIPTIFLNNDPAHGLSAPLTVSAPLNRQQLLQSIRTANPGHARHVLIVDDDESFRHVLRCALEIEGYHVSEAVDGRQAIEQLHSNKPHVVLLDLNLPDVDGWDVIRHLTERPELNDVQLIVISGLILSEQESAEIRSRAAGFISKGQFTVSGVLQQLAETLEPNR